MKDASVNLSYTQARVLAPNTIDAAIAQLKIIPTNAAKKGVKLPAKNTQQKPVYLRQEQMDKLQLIANKSQKNLGDLVQEVLQKYIDQNSR
jgi:hypothetical protein